MSMRRGVVGITMLCALVFSALAAANASAAPSGITAWTCQPNALAGQQEFKDSHCLEAQGGNRGWKHVEITPGSVTQIELTNAGTASGTTAAAVSKLKGALSGVETEVQCTAVEGTGPLQNSTNGEEMNITSSFTFTYSGCSVAKPAGKGCAVSGGKITTKELSATTKEQGGLLKVTPTEGTEFASIKIEGCSVESLNNTFPVTGSLKVAPASTLVVTHSEVTTQGTLKFGGVKAGLDGSVTVKMDSAGGVTSHAITATKVP